MITFPSDDDDTALLRTDRPINGATDPIISAAHYADGAYGGGDDTNHQKIDDDDDLGSIVVLGKGTPDNLKFEWIIGQWSRCSETCGGNGVQLRTIGCIVRLHNTTQAVDNNLCDDAGLSAPTRQRKCGGGDCPQWVTSEWTACEYSKCFASNMGLCFSQFQIFSFHIVF